MKKNKPGKIKIGIVGLGTVGRAVQFWFRKCQFPLFFYDKYKEIGSFKVVNNADIIFLCVPTPYKEKTGYDDSAIFETLEQLEREKIVVIKSTILPGRTEFFQKQFPELKILFNPEFLREKTAIEDFLNPERQIVGYTEKSRDVAPTILDLLPNAPYKKILPAKEAEMIKYAGNVFLATKVIFANQIYDLCQVLKINYELVKEGLGYDKRIGHSHLDILKDGYRGYLGACLPKDLKSLLQLAKEKKIHLKLFETVDNINEVLTRNVGKQ